MAALSEIEKLEARWAENPDGRYFAPLADAYRKAGRVDEAITVAAGGLVKHPDYLSAHIVLGRCYLAKKDDASARAAFERVLTLDGENIIALKSLAEIAERAEAPDDARRWLQRLLTVDAMNSEAADDLARLGGPLVEAGEAGEAAAEPPPDDVRISFADVAVESVPEPAPPVPVAPAEETTAVVPAVNYLPPEVPKTLERPAVTPEMLKMAASETIGMMPAVPSPASSEPTVPVPALELESTAFVPPPPSETPAPAGGDFVPFDDQLQWGAGERQSQAIHAEDLARADQSHAETAAAIDFIGGAPPARTEERPDEPAPEEPMHHVPEPEPITLEPAAHAEPPAGEWDSSPEVPHVAPDLVAAAAAMPEPAPAYAEAAPASDLKLIMPEDVTPAEELRRPSSKQVQMVSPEPADTAPVPAGIELMVTETMADLYLRQGFRDQAAEVYRRLLQTRPGDAGLLAKLAAIESPPAFSASASGTEAVGSWLRRIARAQLPTAAPAAAPVPVAGPSPMDQAFSAPEPEPEPAPVSQPEPEAVALPATGDPARPATDQFSLDRIFGGASAATPAPAPSPTPPSTPLGASFDEFFGAAPKQESVRPSKEIAAPRQSEDDLSAFNAWLHGLKR